MDRHNEVSAKLAQDLTRFLASYRTSDHKVLTEGEVMTAISRIIVSSSTSEDRIAQWADHIRVGAMALWAMKGETQ